MVLKVLRYLPISLFCLFTTVLVTNYYSTVLEERHLGYERKVWSLLDQRPLPEWYDRAKIGISIHWGLCAVPAVGNDLSKHHWERDNTIVDQYVKNFYPPGFTYKDFAPMFKAEHFNPDDWAELFLKSGAKYVVLTSKHHDGYSLYSKKTSTWNALDIGPKRDLITDLSKAVRTKGLKFGLYYYLWEWDNPIYLSDKKRYFTTTYYTDLIMIPELKQIINDYKPSVIWSFGDWDASMKYWKSTEVLKWIYEESPVKDEVVVNDRWGVGSKGVHGDFFIQFDRGIQHKLHDHKWENYLTIDKLSWGYRRNLQAEELQTFDKILEQVVSTVSCGGNVLINIGPTKDGTIIPLFRERLLALGNWLAINGEAIYNTSPWLHQQDSITNNSVWYTCLKAEYDGSHPTAVPNDNKNVTAIYAIFLDKPKHKVRLKNIFSMLETGKYKIELLGTNGTDLKWNVTDGIAEITLPEWHVNDTLHNTLKIVYRNEANVENESTISTEVTTSLDINSNEIDSLINTTVESV